MLLGDQTIITNRNARLIRDGIIHDLEVMITTEEPSEVYKRYGDIRAQLDQLCGSLFTRAQYKDRLDKKRREYRERSGGGETIDIKDRS